MARRALALSLLVPVLSAGAVLGGPATTTPAASAAVTIDGPDVSSYQHPNGASINWSAVAKAGHEFAIVKATEGTSYVNKYFAADYAGIRKAGMVRGSYHFARPATPVASSALAQAKFYVRHIGATNTTATLPPALDLEVTGGLSRTALITWAQDFLLDVRGLTGRTPMLYTYPWFWSHTLGDPAAFSRYPLWMAAYSGGVDVGATLWQYTAGATVSGIKGKVDMSKLLADPATFAALADGVTPTPWPAAAPGVPASMHVSPRVRATAVSWRPPDAGSSALTGYTVTVARTDGTGTARTISLSASRNSTTVTGLTPDTSYAVTVRGRNAVGAGALHSPRTVVPQYPTAAVMTARSVAVAGQHVPLTLTLTRSDDHSALAGARVKVYARPHGARTWKSYGTLTTDARGHATRVFTPGRNDDFRFSYSGATGLAPASAQRSVLVRPAVPAHLSTTRVASRHSVVLTGHTAPAEPRVRVTSEVWHAGHWHVLARKRTGPHGGFRFVVTPTWRGTWYFRVVVAATRSRLAGYSAHLALRSV